MSFRKRSIPLASNIRQSPSNPHSTMSNSASLPTTPSIRTAPGIRTSSHSLSLPTTSTGTPSLDSLLGLGAGLALGHSLAILEYGTTDYAGALLRCFVSQGVLCGHKVFVGASEQWGSNLPGLQTEKPKSTPKERKVAMTGQIGREVERGEKMKIAWRYERLGSKEDSENTESSKTFSYAFDLTTRLERPMKSPEIAYMPPNPLSSLEPISAFLKANPSIPTRLVLPSFLSPLFYPPEANKALIPYLHQLRTLSRSYENLVVALSWPLELYSPKCTPTRWLERLVDGVITLEAFPHNFSFDSVAKENRKEQDSLQGFLRVRKLPAITERGLGIGSGDEMMFSMSKHTFTIRPYNLPPLDNHGGGGGDGGEDGDKDKDKQSKLEF